MIANLPHTKMMEFQSTHLREVRRNRLAMIQGQVERFNPRTYVRCDINGFVKIDK